MTQELMLVKSHQEIYFRKKPLPIYQFYDWASKIDLLLLDLLTN